MFRIPLLVYYVLAELAFCFVCIFYYLLDGISRVSHKNESDFRVNADGCSRRGVVTPVIGFAIDNAGITAGVIVILLCVLYLTYCAFAVGERKCGEQTYNK